MHNPLLHTPGDNSKYFYGTQVRSDPPTFMIYVNDPKLMHFSYMRFLENRIRAEYGVCRNADPNRCKRKKREIKQMTVNLKLTVILYLLEPIV